MNKISSVIKNLESIKHICENGGEYWFARELMTSLGYLRWENFHSVIDKAKKSCVQVNEDIDDHFRDVTKVIEAGKKAMMEVKDYYLDRYACYLIAQNGNPSKTEIAAAQTYFAIQTRRQEISDAENRLLDQRIRLRHRVTRAVKELNKVAKEAGVQKYAAFHDAGYRGLYSMGLAEIKKYKGIDVKEELFDRAGRAELAANEFRLTQAEQKIKREQIANETDAIMTHRKVGEEVRETIRKIGGIMPEDLQPEPSLKRLTNVAKKKSLITAKN